MLEFIICLWLGIFFLLVLLSNLDFIVVFYIVDSFIHVLQLFCNISAHILLFGQFVFLELKL